MQVRSVIPPGVNLHAKFFLGHPVVRVCLSVLIIHICKLSVFNAFYATFEKVRRYASKEVVIRLRSPKGVPVTLHAVEACPLSTARYRVAAQLSD